MNDLVTAGDLLSKCDIVGASNPAEGFTIAAFCYQHEISYGQFAETYNLMHGRISKRVDAMLTDANAMGIQHECLTRTPEQASIQLTLEGGRVVQETLTHDQVKGEKFYTKNPKWKTEYSRRQMLWARVVSESLRTHVPAACSGMYTAEEMEDVHAEDTLPAVLVQVPPTPLPPTPPTPDGVVLFPEHVQSCPIGASAGKPWNEFSAEDLAIALTVNEIPEDHKAFIRSILQEAK